MIADDDTDDNEWQERLLACLLACLCAHRLALAGKSWRETTSALRPAPSCCSASSRATGLPRTCTPSLRQSSSTIATTIMSSSSSSSRRCRRPRRASSPWTSACPTATFCSASTLCRTMMTPQPTPRSSTTPRGSPSFAKPTDTTPRTTTLRASGKGGSWTRYGS